MPVVIALERFHQVCPRPPAFCSTTTCSSSPARSSTPRARCDVMMGRAMNSVDRQRSLRRVRLGDRGARAEPHSRTGAAWLDDAEDLAIMLAYAQRSSSCPGYGLAVPRATGVPLLAELLEHRIDVLTAPGRGPDARPHEHSPRRGRRPYRKTEGMDEINSELPQTDVVSFSAPTTSNPARLGPRAARSTGCRSSTSTARQPSSW
jgi:NAD/NADP transhydrogenase beta subunit